MSVEVRNDLPMLNLHLLRDLVLWAGKDKAVIDKAFDGWGNWEQSSWARQVRNGVCKSSYCIAGQAVVQKGYALVLRADHRLPDGSTQFSADYCVPGIEDGTDERGNPIIIPDPSGTQRSIEDAAVDVIGLAWEEIVLFNGDNDFVDVVTIASYIARRRGLSLDLPRDIAVHDLNIDDVQFYNFSETERYDIDDEEDEED